ncbi:MAG: PilW family protein [Candidatus Thiodiazotropha endolucinida]
MQCRKHTHSGFSLISLMIASAISLFLVGGIDKIYLDSKNAFNARAAISVATEKYRLVFQEMRRALIMAGRGIATSADSAAAYADGREDTGMRTFPAVGRYPDGIANGVTHSGDEWNPAPEDSSIVAVRYAAGPAPCGLNDETVGDGTVTVRFLVDSEGDLNCQVYQNGALIQSQPIASDISQMRVLYGIDTDKEPDGVANLYLTADHVESHNWMNVVSIRIGLVVSSGVGYELPRPYRPQTPEELDLLGATFTTPDNNFIYKSASTTISLRNLHHMDRQFADN